MKKFKLELQKEFKNQFLIKNDNIYFNFYIKAVNFLFFNLNIKHSFKT